MSVPQAVSLAAAGLAPSRSIDRLKGVLLRLAMASSRPAGERISRSAARLTASSEADAAIDSEFASALPAEELRLGADFSHRSCSVRTRVTCCWRIAYM